MGLDTKTYLLTDRQSQCDFDFDYTVDPPCGGGVEYLHRHPESRRRRRKGKSQIWESTHKVFCLHYSFPDTGF
jgi:hypothetical protein